jgi:hypothetical protein
LDNQNIDMKEEDGVKELEYEEFDFSIKIANKR